MTSQFLLLLVLVVGAVIAFVWLTYNTLVKLKMRIQEAWADIDVQLKKRYDLLPDLIETARKATAVDEKILTKVTELRAQAMESSVKNEEPEKRAKIESQLSGMMRDIKVQVEAYPEIRSHQELTDLMNKTTEIEEHIAYSRRYYNATVLEYNTKIKMFPSMIIASVFNFHESEFFAANEQEREDVKVDFDKNPNA